MKLRLSSLVFLFALTSPAFADNVPGKLYMGFFGGYGLTEHFDGHQYGTSFRLEADGGPLAVNAFGELSDESTPFFGLQIGHQVHEISLHSDSKWTFGPVVELEAYSMNKRSYSSTLFNNTLRTREREFSVSYPMKKSVFLANAVLNLNHPSYPVNTYFGVGIGSAIVKITDATSLQNNLPEEGNHYNAHSNDTTSTFAGQLKLGLNYNISKCITLFAEYRWLYLANTHFTFGSMVNPLHPETSSWQVNFNSQRHHLGDIGVRFNW